MALRLISRSPRRRIRLVTVVSELTTCPRPVGSTCLRRLGISNGCQDHTVLPYASTPFVCAPLSAHKQKARPAINLRADAVASTATRPNVRDDGQRPSSRDRMDQSVAMICPTAKAEYFSRRGWTRNAPNNGSDLPVGPIGRMRSTCQSATRLFLAGQRQTTLARRNHLGCRPIKNSRPGRNVMPSSTLVNRRNLLGPFRRGDRRAIPGASHRSRS